MVPGIGHMDYEERLKVCRLTTLEQRRQRGDMIYVYKMLNVMPTNNFDNFFCFTNQRHDVSTRSSTNNFLVAEKCHLDVRKHFFNNRIVQTWNALPSDVRDAESVNSFKIGYDEWMTCSVDYTK